MIDYIMDGATSHGIHSYMAFAKCAYKATQQTLQHHHFHTDGTAEGSILHAYSHLYYEGNVFEPEDVRFPNQPFTGDQLKEAIRVWKAYRTKFPPDEWGTVLCLEKQLGGPLLEAAIGVPYTFKPDVICELDEDQAHRISLLRGVDIRSGRYGVDHKFLKSTPTNLEFTYPNSLQFVAYALGWNAANPDQQLDGWIVNVCIKNKEPKFITMVLDPPDEVQIASLRSSMKWWKYLKDNHPLQTNPLEDNCFPYGKPCYYWTSGECDRGENLVNIGRMKT